MKKEIAKDHHRIPKVYMKNWCISNENVQTYNKKTKKFKNKNINNIFKTKYYNSYTAGEINNTQKVNKEIFSPLNDYIVKYNGKNLTTPNQLNKHFNDYDNWEIIDINNKKIKDTEKNRIKTELIDNKDATIEKKFSQKYEKDWCEYVESLYNAVINDERFDFRKLCEYMYLFLNRNPYGDEYWQKPLLDYLVSFLGGMEDKTIPIENRIYTRDTTPREEIIHDSNIRRYKELIYQYGASKKIVDILNKHTRPLFFIDNASRFLTSDTNVIFEDNSLFFVISPKVCVLISSKYNYDIFENKYNCTNDYVMLNDINKYIFNHANEIVLFRSMIDLPFNGKEERKCPE